MARVRKKAEDIALTAEQLIIAKDIFRNVQFAPLVKVWHEEREKLYDVFINGNKYYIEDDDEELDEIELDEMFSNEHRANVIETIDLFNDINKLAPIWKKIASSTKMELLTDVRDFAIRCGADEAAVEREIGKFDFRMLVGGGLRVNSRSRGKPSPYPGQWEVTVCLLQFWIDAGNEFQLGRIQYEDGTLTPSPMVKFISRYLTEIDPKFSISKDEKMPIDEQKLRRAHRILLYIKDAGKIPARSQD